MSEKPHIFPVVKIHVESDGFFTRIEVDGKKLTNVTGFSITQRAGEFPVLHLDLMAQLVVEGALSLIGNRYDIRDCVPQSPAVITDGPTFNNRVWSQESMITKPDASLSEHS